MRSNLRISSTLGLDIRITVSDLSLRFSPDFVRPDLGFCGRCNRGNSWSRPRLQRGLLSDKTRDRSLYWRLHETTNDLFDRGKGLLRFSPDLVRPDCSLDLTSGDGIKHVKRDRGP